MQLYMLAEGKPGGDRRSYRNEKDKAACLFRAKAGGSIEVNGGGNGSDYSRTKNEIEPELPICDVDGGR